MPEMESGDWSLISLFRRHLWRCLPELMPGLEVGDEKFG